MGHPALRRALLALLSIVVTACAGSATRDAPVPRSTSSAAGEHGTPPAPPPRIPPSAAVSTLLVAGDTFWGRYVEDWAERSPLGAAYPFSGLHELRRDRYDAWIANLECPVVPGLRLSSSEQERLLSFNCDPRFLAEARRWFTAFSLANNHTDNQGARGLRATRRQLDRHGVQHFGDADPRVLDRVCSVITVPAAVVLPRGRSSSGVLPLAMCGLNGVFRIPPAAAVERVGEYARALPTIVMPHGGLEYTAHPDSIKVELARDLIEAGADAVLGAHPHWVQPAEVHRGRLIVHSLGNFLFDQQGDAEVTRSAAIRVRITVEGPHLERWLGLGEQCRAQPDDCFAGIRRAALPRPTIRMEFSVVGTTNRDRVPRPAAPAETAGIRERLGWASVVSSLEAPYAARP